MNTIRCKNDSHTSTYTKMDPKKISGGIARRQIFCLDCDAKLYEHTVRTPFVIPVKALAERRSNPRI